MIPLTDSVIDQLGHDVHSCYVGTYWLPILGPSAIWAGRPFADWLEASPESVEAPLESLARSLGLCGGVARNSPIVRTLVRLVDFGVASVGGECVLQRTVQSEPDCTSECTTHCTDDCTIVRITLVGARGGSGTTTIAAALAMIGRTMVRTELVTTDPDVASGLLGALRRTSSQSRSSPGSAWSATQSAGQS